MAQGQSTELLGRVLAPSIANLVEVQHSSCARLAARRLQWGSPKVVYFARHGRSPGTLVPIAGTHVRPDRTQQEIAPRATMAKEAFVRWFMRFDCGPFRSSPLGVLPAAAPPR